MHLTRKKIYDIMALHNRTRLMNYTIDERGCWNWIFRDGKDHPNRYGPYRRIYTLYNGPIPKGKCVMHACDNRNCVNPNHLVLGTHCDNMYDWSSKGQRLKGGTKIYAWKANLLREKDEIVRKMFG
jgi:hypothetical protein